MFDVFNRFTQTQLLQCPCEMNCCTDLHSDSIPSYTIFNFKCFDLHTFLIYLFIYFLKCCVFSKTLHSYCNCAWQENCAGCHLHQLFRKIIEKLNLLNHLGHSVFFKRTVYSSPFCRDGIALVVPLLLLKAQFLLKEVNNSSKEQQ